MTGLVGEPPSDGEGREHHGHGECRRNHDAAVSDAVEQAGKAERRDHRAPAERGEGDRDLALPAAERAARSEEHTSELQSLLRNSYAVFCLLKTTNAKQQ